MKELQKDIRMLWTVVSLLDGKKKNQNQITKFLNNIDRQIKSDSPGSPMLINTNNSLQSPIIIELERKEIIEREEVPVEGRNLNAQMCVIPKNLNALSNIMILIEDSQVDEKRKRFFRNQLMHSKLGTSLINRDFVNKLQKNKKIPSTDFEPSEGEFITKALRNSSQALSYTILSIHDNADEWELRDAKDIYLYKLQSLLTLDLIEQYKQLHENQRSSEWIKFATKISFPKDSESGNTVSAHIKEDKMNFYFTLDFLNSKFRDLDKPFKEYIRTFS